MDNLVEEFREIKRGHWSALRTRIARTALGPSVLRVFERGTKEEVIPVLSDMDPDELLEVKSKDAFRLWFEDELALVADCIRAHNRSNSRIFPGYKWGHATKVLTLFLRDIVVHSRHFSDQQVEQISPLLYAPVDGMVIKWLRKLEMKPPFNRINQIDSAKKFYWVQDLLGEAADEVGVPRIWFDDVWARR